MPTQADKVFREFNRYSGDGLANEPAAAPLPIGDPKSGEKHVKKKEIRDWANSFEAGLEDAIQRAEDAADRVDLGALDSAVEDAEAAALAAANSAASVDLGALVLAVGAAEDAVDAAELARDLAETYAGIDHRAATWAELALISGTAGQTGYVSDTDTGTHTDPVAGGTVPNAGVFTWDADGLGSAEAERTGSTGLAGKVDKFEGQMALNSGAHWPLVPAPRNLINSPANAAMNAFLLGVKVRGAASGNYYRAAYFTNRNASFPGNPSDWIIEECRIAPYATAFEGRSIIMSHDDEVYGVQPAIDYAGGIQTVTLIFRTRPGLEIDLTVDASKLPASGTPIDMYTLDSMDGWSWYIDPACYFYAAPNRTDPISYSLSADGVGGFDALIAWASGPDIFRTSFGRIGHNSLPNIGALFKALLNGDRIPTYTILESEGTDRLPPLSVRAVNDGDAGTALETGGNHGSTGSASGAVTARCILYQAYVDGNLITAAKSGVADELRFVVVNELMAYNTITTGRYVLRQTFTVIFRAGGCEVVSEVVPYEEVELVKDNGPQMATVGFLDAEQLYVGGAGIREDLDTTTNSGSRALYPNAWAFSLKNPNVHKGTWMDRTYGVGDGRYVGPTTAFMRGGGAINTKVYHAAISGAGPIMQAGDRYAWRGGYWWTSPAAEPAGIDCTFPVYRNGVAQSVVVYDDLTWTVSPNLADQQAQLSDAAQAEIVDAAVVAAAAAAVVQLGTLTPTPVFESQALALAYDAPASVTVIEIRRDGQLMRYQRGSNVGTGITTNAGAVNWEPAGEASPYHFYAAGFDANTVRLQAFATYCADKGIPCRFPAGTWAFTSVDFDGAAIVSDAGAVLDGTPVNAGKITGCVLGGVPTTEAYQGAFAAPPMSGGFVVKYRDFALNGDNAFYVVTKGGAGDYCAVRIRDIVGADATPRELLRQQSVFSAVRAWAYQTVIGAAYTGASWSDYSYTASILDLGSGVNTGAEPALLGRRANGSGANVVMSVQPDLNGIVTVAFFGTTTSSDNVTLSWSGGSKTINTDTADKRVIVVKLDTGQFQPFDLTITNNASAKYMYLMGINLDVPDGLRAGIDYNSWVTYLRPTKDSYVINAGAAEYAFKIGEGAFAGSYHGAEEAVSAAVWMIDGMDAGAFTLNVPKAAQGSVRLLQNTLIGAGVDDGNGPIAGIRSRTIYEFSDGATTLDVALSGVMQSSTFYLGMCMPQMLNGADRCFDQIITPFYLDAQVEGEYPLGPTDTITWLNERTGRKVTAHCRYHAGASSLKGNVYLKAEVGTTSYVKGYWGLQTLASQEFTGASARFVQVFA